MNNNPIEIGDTVWTRNIMLFVDGIDPKTGESIETKFGKRDTLKVVALPDTNSQGDNNYTLETRAGLHVWMTRDQFETIDDPRE